MSFEYIETFFVENMDINELPEYNKIGIFLFFMTISLFIFLAWYNNRLQYYGQHRQQDETFNTNNSEDQSRKPGFKLNVKCTICFENSEWPIQTNCGHIYCGSCFITYYDHGTFLKGATCPLCRTNVNILIPQWPDAFELQNEKNSKIKDDFNDEYKHQIVKKIKWYNRRFSGGKISLWEQIRDLPVILRNIFRHTLNNQGVALFYRIRVAFLLIFVLIYVAIPKDFVPENIFGVAGFIDDIFIIFLVILQLAVHFRRAINE